MPTLYEIAKTVPLGHGNGRKKAPSLAAGIKPEPFVTNPGLRTLSAEQLCSLEVPRLTRVNGGFDGFQREAYSGQVKKVADAMQRGIPVPAIEVALVDDEQWCVDGQHRALAAILLRRPLYAVVRRMSDEQAQALFSNQGKGRRVNANLLVLAADDPFSEYVQDALTSANHVWAEMVGQTASAGRISPNQMVKAISSYSADRLGQSSVAAGERFDQGLCDELGHLVRAFGTKHTNPAAFRPLSFRSLTDAAILVVRRRGSLNEDVERWVRHMPAFPFSSYAHLRRSGELTDALLAHWNKKLSRPDRRVAR